MRHRGALLGWLFLAVAICSLGLRAWYEIGGNR